VALSAAFGDNILPQANGNLAVLSTGTARDADQPNHTSPIPGFEDATNSSLAPAAFLAARGNQLYSKPGCPAVSGSNPVYDMVLLRLRLRVPTNADGIQFQHVFLTSQFPDVCTQYNDHFLALISTMAPGIPSDRNIAFDQMANPVTVQTSFYPVCTPVGSQGCPYGPAQLAGTGFDPAAAGSTGWNTTVAPVIGGEIITLEFHIFDVGDHQFDSTVLLDNLTWHVLPQAPPLSAVDDQPVPGSLAPLRAAPNPFNPSTRLTFTLPRAGAVQLAVFDLAGRRIATLVDAALEAGDHQAVWDGRGDDGQSQPAGVYHARLTGGGSYESAAIVLLK
jgi:hypothetical protein